MASQGLGFEQLGQILSNSNLESPLEDEVKGAISLSKAY
jgi:hypothetical protein